MKQNVNFVCIIWHNVLTALCNLSMQQQMFAFVYIFYFKSFAVYVFFFFAVHGTVLISQNSWHPAHCKMKGNQRPRYFTAKGRLASTFQLMIYLDSVIFGCILHYTIQAQSVVFRWLFTWITWRNIQTMTHLNMNFSTTKKLCFRHLAMLYMK